MKDGWSVPKNRLRINRRDNLLGWIFVFFTLMTAGTLGKILFYGSTRLAWGIIISIYAAFSVLLWIILCLKDREAGLLFKISRFPLAFIVPIYGFITIAYNMIRWIFRRQQAQSKPFIGQRIKKTGEKRGSLVVGDKVFFHAPGSGRVEGIITRFNKKTVKVITGPDVHWNIPSEFLKKVRQPTVKPGTGTGLQLVKG